MMKDALPLAAALLALALSLTGCATTRTVEPPAAARSDLNTEAQEAPALAGTRVVASGPVPPPPEGPVPLRLPAQVMRIWIAPWEDSRGDLHAPGYLYTEIEPRRWSLGASAEPDRDTLIRPLQIERRDAKPDPAGSGRDSQGNARPRKGGFRKQVVLACSSRSAGLTSGLADSRMARRMT